MRWLLRTWFFLRFVDAQNLNLHEYMHTPRMEKFRDSVAYGEVNMDEATTAFAHARLWHRLFRQISVGRAEKICVDAIGAKFIMPLQDRRPHRASLIMTEKGHVFSKSTLGLVDELRKRYPPLIAIIGFIVTGSAFVFVDSAYHFVGKVVQHVWPH